MNLSVAKKIGSSSLLMAALILSAGLAGLNGVSSLSRSLNYISNQAWDAAEGAMEGTIFIQAELLASKEVLSGSVAFASGESKINEAVTEADIALKRMADSGLIDQSLLNELNPAIQEFRRARAEVISRYKGMTEAERGFASTINKEFVKLKKNLDSTAENLLTVLGKVEEKANATVEGEKAGIESIQSLAYTTVIVVIIIGLLVAVANYLWSMKIIVRPIQKVAASLRLIDENGGDLTHEIEVKGNDEIAELSRGFNFFMSTTRKIINQVKETSAQINSEGDTLNQIIDETNKGATSQKAEIEQVAAAVAELVATIASVSTHADEATVVSDSAVHSMEDGKKQVQDTVSNVQQLSTDMDHASVVINNVQSEANNIGSVLEVIRGIAEQTNLLALNAAIEAARAGEQGRGFAVVADEVRTLASRTQESTTEIQAMIDSLQSGSKSAVDVISKSFTQTEESLKSASKASESLNAIVVAISNLSEINHQIAVATREQKVASSAIESNAEEIHSVADATAEKTSVAQSSIMQLVARSNAMSEVVAKFVT